MGFCEAWTTCLGDYQYLDDHRVGAHARSLNVAETRSPDLQVRVYLQCYIPDLSPNVFALAITIGPDEQDGCISGLGFDVTSHGLFVLFTC